MIQFLKFTIFVLPWCSTGRVASGFLSQQPAQRRQLNRPTNAALPWAVPLLWHLPTSPAVTFIVDPEPGMVSHRSRQIALDLAAIEATPALNDNKNYKDPMDEYTLSVPDRVPQSFEYQRKIFYVRKCYDEYYNQIMDLLKTYDYISVTGTEGIGKSLFYLYFFQRYRKEFPHKSLVTASFSDRQILKSCKLFRHDSSEWRQDIPFLGLPDWPEDFDCDLYLYDGSPDVRPADGKMIAFTTPNGDWLDSIRKDSNHRTVYMPLWTFQELLHAVDVLKLDISKETLEQRFTFFGGTARYCITSKAAFSNKERRRVEGSLSKIDRFQQVEDCFNRNWSLAKYLMHYVPQMNNRFATLVPSTYEISGSLEKSISKNLFRERDKFLLHLQWLENLCHDMLQLQCLEGANKANVFYGWLYKIFVHTELLKGGDFVVRSLLESKLQHIQVDKMVGQYKRFKPSICMEDAILKLYRIPESSFEPSIDSYMVTESCLLMFQITIQSNHPIKASGLVSVLNKLQMLERVKEHPESAKIIFVVPQGMGPEFQNQKIGDGECQFFSDLENLDCTVVTGIDHEKKRKLAEHNIFNCKQLILAYDNGEACVKSAKKHIAKLRILWKRSISWSF